MGVRNSDVIRFALKCCIARLGPLLQPELKGRDLVPLFVDAGSDIVRYLDLDAAQIDSIINDDVAFGEKVDRADIHLLAGTGAQQSYPWMRNAGAVGARAAPLLSPGDEDSLLSHSLHRYFYDKYMSEVPAQAPPQTSDVGGAAP